MGLKILFSVVTKLRQSSVWSELVIYVALVICLEPGALMCEDGLQLTPALEFVAHVTGEEAVGRRRWEKGEVRDIVMVIGGVWGN